MKPERTLEFVVEDGETTLVVDTARASAGDDLDRITVSPIDGTPRSRVIIALRGETFSKAMTGVMDAVMKALEQKR